MSRPAGGMDGMLKVAIVGCGKIADAHASQIQRIEECEIVGVCDREPLMAKQLYEQFSHVARRMKAVVGSGYLGGVAVHMESYHGYDLGDPGYARALLADKQHWVRRLPGRLLQNLISHGIARIAEFLTSDTPQVIA